jgi:uncharacterized protein
LSVPELATILSMSGIIFLSAVLRGFTGFGFGLAAVPLMGLVIEPAGAVLIALALQFLGGASDLRAGRQLAHWPTLRWLMLGALAGTPVGMAALMGVSSGMAQLLISAVCLSAVGLLAAGRSFVNLPGRGATVAVGALAGLFNGLAAMPGPPVVAFYLAAPVSAQVARVSLVVFFTVTAALALTPTILGGWWTPELVLTAAAGLPLMIFGTHAGNRLFRAYGARHHRAASLAVFACIALVSGVHGIAAVLSAAS